MVYNNIPMADAHNDLLLGVHYQRERGYQDPFGDFWLPQLRSGGVVLQVLPVFTEEQHVGEGALRRSLLVLETARWLAEEHRSDVAIVETSNELRKAIDNGQIAMILALEGAEPIGADVSVIDTFWRLGVRIASLTWNRRTMLADGTGESRTGGRLTTLGVEAIAEMERIGMVVDVSHLSDAGVAHVAELVSRPFVATHSACRALQPHPRNLTDSQVEVIAASGGFVGLNAFGPFLADDPALAHYVDHIEHAVKLVGAEHVALGPDFIEDLINTVDPVLGKALVNLEDLSILEDMARPADLAGLGPLLIDRLGESDARAVASETMISLLERLLP
ncbi:MAG: thermostable dipeptidase [Gammaproteobacteria bacterium]|nr:thermostable dipeptidase [Gammaproteobacteria bacterium]